MGKFYRRSLSVRVLMISLVIFALPMLIYFLIVIHSNYERRLRETVIRLVELGHSRASLFREAYNYSINTLNIIYELTKGTDALSQTAEPKPILTDFLQSAVRGGHFNLAFYVAQVDGQWIATAATDPRLIGKNLSGMHYIETAAVHGQASFIALGPETLNRYLYVVKRIYDPKTGEPIGMFLITTLANTVVDEMVRSESTDYTVNVSLIDDGVVIASGNPDLLLNFIYAPDIAPYVSKTESQDVIELVPLPGTKGASTMKVGGATNLAVELQLPQTHLRVLLDASEEEVFGQESSRLFHVLALFLIIFLIGGALALWITKQMSLPWIHLGLVMDRVSQGDLTARFEPHKMGFEINDLGIIFNHSVDSLCDQMAEAEAERVQKETLKQELNIGYEIQLAILPKIGPSYPGAEIAARYSPAKEVGGDFYDVFVKETEEGEQIFLTVADAAGKGISACLYSLGLRSMIRSSCAAYDDLGRIVTETNHLFCKDSEETGMFVTLFSARFEPQAKRLTYTSCGHTPAILRRSSGEIELLQTEGIAMGVDPTAQFKVKTVQLQKGDLICFYTDGVTESHNVRNELFGEKRLIAFLQGQGEQSSGKVGDQLLAALDTYRGAAPPFDDITALIIRIL
ncbi:MAG: SpoIIE family protein phosphatase [Verrucomicrobia bacterium]|nr:SpoIIE family protein phosphatase [Verrucomicrobiota bacterium]